MLTIKTNKKVVTKIKSSPNSFSYFYLFSKQNNKTFTMAILGLDELKSWLWESANILRGSIDSSDFKNYIFGLLF